MSFVVTHVSRGDILLGQGSQTVRVQGEGLLASRPGDSAFVVYLNSIDMRDSDGKAAPMSEATRELIVEAIQRYFADKGMGVEFE